MPLHMPSRRSHPSLQAINLPLRLFGLVPESIVDGPGVRFVVFVQGCPHHCPGCHNPGSHDFGGGIISSTAEVWEKIEKMPHLEGVTFSGGEPFCQPEPLAQLGRLARERGLTVMTYTGYTAEALFDMAETDSKIRELLSVTNYLVDGRFEADKRDLTLKYRGSSNQRILDITAYPNSKNYIPAEFC